MGRLRPPTDFSSASYWSARFSSETSFEWLSPSAAILPLLLDIARDIAVSRRSSSSERTSQERTSQGRDLPQEQKQEQEQRQEFGEPSHPELSGPSELPLHILHFGCGTSSLGIDLARALEAEQTSIPAEVIDADYVAADIQVAIPSPIPFPSPGLHDVERTEAAGGEAGGEAGGRGRERADPPRPIPLISLNVLDPLQMAEKAPEGGWDLLIDKSTADAISCGPDVDLGPKLSAGGESGVGGERGDGGGPGDRGGPGDGGALKDGGHEDMGEATNGTVDGEGEGDADGTQTQKRRSTVEPIVALCERLGAVTRPGGKWVCISYSERRFAHLEAKPRLSPSATPSTLTLPRSTSRIGENEGEGEEIGMGWKLLQRIQLDDAQSGGKVIQDGKGERVVFGPKTGAWVYILERLGAGAGGGFVGEAGDAVEGTAE